MKKVYVFLCVVLVLFLGSCADLSVSDDEAIKADLPADFDWNVYANINNDVKISQIIVDVREKNKEYGDSLSKVNCVNILQDLAFAKKVYVNYMQCPEQGWPLNEKCSGKYAYNKNYTIVKGTDTTCVIDDCWHGGWSELEEGWEDSLENYSGIVKAMCQFIPKKENSAEAQRYLETFPYKPYLIEMHYHLFGRSDGRPYKKCAASSSCDEKTQRHADKRKKDDYTYYYDYGRYLFCLNDRDQICVVQ